MGQKIFLTAVLQPALFLLVSKISTLITRQWYVFMFAGGKNERGRKKGAKRERGKKKRGQKRQKGKKINDKKTRQ